MLSFIWCMLDREIMIKSLEIVCRKHFLNTHVLLLWVSPFNWKYRHLLAKHSTKNQSYTSHKCTVMSAMLLV